MLLIFIKFDLKASDLIIFEEGNQPYFENKFYKVWILSILNDEENCYLNVSILPKARFRHPTYHKLKKSDRTEIVSYDIKIKEFNGEKIIGVLPFQGLATKLANKNDIPWINPYLNESSANLNDKELNYVTLKFGGNLSHKTTKISILQNDNDTYFSFIDIPVSVPYHKEWENRYKNIEDLKFIIDASTDPISGIYELNNMQYACILEGSTYYLINLNNSENLIWHFGEVAARFNPTAISGFFKGTIKASGDKSQTDFSFILNGDFIEAKGKFIIPGFQIEGRYIPPKEEEYQLTYRKIYSPNHRTSKPMEERDIWSGTCFALKNGFIITNNHIIENASDIKIYGINGNFTKGYKASLIGGDKGGDLALLKIDDIESELYWENPPYDLKTSMVELGEEVFTLGFPLIATMGEEIKLTTGIISSRSGFKGDVSTYQISIPLQPGNSGGPLFDKNGNIIGIINAKYEGAENVGYAVKSSYICNLIESLDKKSIIPQSHDLNYKPLNEMVKKIKNYVFLIKCSK